MPHWEVKRLGDLCRIDLGKTPARADKTFWDARRDTSNVWLSIADLLNAENKIVVDSREYLSDRGAAVSRLVPSGTLLLSFKLTLGRLAFAGRDLYTNEAIAALTILNEKELSKEYLYWYLSSIDWLKFAEADIKLKGVTLNKAKLHEIPVCLPTLAEQERIVVLLDEAVDALARARANMELNRAYSHEVLSQQLRAVFADAWRSSQLVRLSDIASEVTDGDHQPPPKSAAGVPFITISNIDKQTGQIDFSGAFSVSREYFEGIKPHRRPRNGDVLYTVTGSLGIPVLVTGEREFCFQRHIALVRPNSETVPLWLYYLLMSPQVFQQADDGATGTAQRTVTLQLLRNFEVPKLEPSQQAKDVARLQALTAESQQLANAYRRKLTVLAELQQSLIRTALATGL